MKKSLIVLVVSIPYREPPLFFWITVSYGMVFEQTHHSHALVFQLPGPLYYIHSKEGP